MDDKSAVTRFMGVPPVSRSGVLDEICDAMLIKDLQRTQELSEAAAARFGLERILAPTLIARSGRRFIEGES